MSQATLVDPESGVRQEVEFFGVGSSRMFGSLHLPEGAARSAVLICSPFQSEFMANYRREVLLARALAARGIAVGRFHYRGTGHSDGDVGDVTFDTMREDAIEATDWLMGCVDIEHLGFLGTRWGALVAASAATEHGSAPLAVWDPATDGRTYFREVFRLRAMNQLSKGADATSVDALEEMREAGYADIGGFAVHQAMFDSASGRTLSGVLGAVPRAVLLVQVDPRTDLKAGYRPIVELWERSGFEVSVHLIEGQEAWWFLGSRRFDASLPQSKAMVDVTVDWFSRHPWDVSDDA